VFSRGKDDWETPAAFFAALDAEFAFTTDAAAVAATAKCPRFFGPGSPWAPDALAVAWPRGRYFLNPPYSQTAAFIAKAAAEAARGSLVVCLVASRTDVRWWHAHVYDGTTWSYRPGVAVRFLKGRLQFVGGQASAPFPSVVLVFQGRTAS
jgi:site-specific DNA-methyltransferase (adenine-specific)